MLVGGRGGLALAGLCCELQDRKKFVLNLKQGMPLLRLAVLVGLVSVVVVSVVSPSKPGMLEQGGITLE